MPKNNPRRPMPPESGQPGTSHHRMTPPATLSAINQPPSTITKYIYQPENRKNYFQLFLHSSFPGTPWPWRRRLSRRAGFRACRYGRLSSRQFIPVPNGPCGSHPVRHGPSAVVGGDVSRFSSWWRFPPSSPPPGERIEVRGWPSYFLRPLQNPCSGAL